MKQSNMDSIADGIFAIVMTLLVFEIKVPTIYGLVTNEAIWKSITLLYPLFLSYILSFSLLFTYWRSYHLIASVYAKNTDFTLTNIGGVFFLLVALAPFSSHLLGTYSEVPMAIILFAVNIILVSLTLFVMRKYATRAATIEKEPVSNQENHRAYTRILLPLFCALIAIIISFSDTKLALFLLTIGILFNLSKNSTHIIFSIINPLIGRKLG